MEKGRITFKECLERRKIIEEYFANDTVLLELEEAEHDLKSAKKSIETKDYKWATVQSYYSMFRAARSLLFLRGYREKSHSCGIAALEHLFEKEIGFKNINNLVNAKRLREEADYEFSFSEYGAKDTIENAEEFIKKVKEILKENKL